MRWVRSAGWGGQRQGLGRDKELASSLFSMIALLFGQLFCAYDVETLTSLATTTQTPVFMTLEIGWTDGRVADMPS